MKNWVSEKRIIALITIVVLLCASLATSFCLTDSYETKTDKKPISTVVVSPINQKSDEEIGQETVNKLREYYGNDDIVGKLVIEGSNIDEPILQSTDNSYYLSHNAYGDWQMEGSVYADYRTKIGDKKVLIFGHSSPGWDVPFNELEEYYNKDYYDNHKYIKIYSEKGIDIYQIFSVFVETSDFSYMNLKITNDRYKKDLKKYYDNSLYKTGVTVEGNEDIVILQTCSNNSKYSNYKKKFLLIVGKKLKKEEENEKGVRND